MCVNVLTANAVPNASPDPLLEKSSVLIVIHIHAESWRCSVFPDVRILNSWASLLWPPHPPKKTPHNSISDFINNADACSSFHPFRYHYSGYGGGWSLDSPPPPCPRSRTHTHTHRLGADLLSLHIRFIHALLFLSLLTHFTSFYRSLWWLYTIQTSLLF